ncbi:MAG: carboxyl-terminal processing [Planctomycetota bacterium]|nr:MAG: carboxyl-terminal processing [Planctomycetota bacterium]
MTRLRACLLSSVALSALLVALAGNVSAGPAEDVKQRVDQLPTAKGAEFWRLVAELEQLGPEAVGPLSEALKAPEAKVRMGVAKALYRCGEKKEAVATLVTLLAEKDKEVRRTSADLLADLTRNDANFGNRKEIESVLQDALDSADDQRFIVALSRALYGIASNIRATDELKKLLKAKDGEVRKEAALALAELEDFDDALPILKQISAEPGDKGSLARLYLKHKALQDSLLRNKVGPAAGGGEYALLDEMIKLIEGAYVDRTKADKKALIEGAARGIAETLDPYSVYLSEKDLKELQEGINKKYGGIGAHVSGRDDWLTIERPVYDGPAYRAGIRSMDRVVDIEGKSTYKTPLEDCVSRLKGEPGTKVRFKVARRGWAEPREFTLERAQIVIHTSVGDMLPGKVGFIQINSFGGDTNEEMRAAIDRLTTDGAIALIIDLRNNPGGLLGEVVQMVDRFVPAGKVICTTKDRDGKVIDELKSTGADEFQLPVAVLINEGSASAAEIMSGALQDFGISVTIGERSYGKGSVQRIQGLSTDKNSAFKYTFAKYYLPSGRSIHIERDRYGKVDEKAEGGVIPDIAIKLPERDLWKEFEFARILDSGKLDEYLTANYDKNKDAFTKLADETVADPAAYPGFDDLMKALKTKAEPSEVAQLARQHVRGRVADDRKREFLVDLNLDTQAQRAVLEVLKKAKVDAETVAEYKPFAHSFDK